MLRYFCKEKCILPYNKAKLLSLLHIRYVNHICGVNITAGIVFLLQLELFFYYEI